MPPYDVKYTKPCDNIMYETRTIAINLEEAIMQVKMFAPNATIRFVYEISVPWTGERRMVFDGDEVNAQL